MADDHHAATAKARQPAQNRLIVAEIAVAGERHPVVEHLGDIMFEMRSVWVTRNLRLLPGRQLRIDIAQQFRGLVLQPCDIIIDVERGVVPHFAQFGNLPIERGDLFFEVQKGCHGGSR
jgi:hypothetical protein